MGIDPTHIYAVQSGEEAVAELAAIPDTPELERADEEICRTEDSDTGDAARQVKEKLLRLAELYRSGQRRIDFADASPFEVLAFCLATRLRTGIEMSVSAGETSDAAQPNAAIRCTPNLTVCPSRA
jgi:hypothetical protein